MKHRLLSLALTAPILGGCQLLLVGGSATGGYAAGWLTTPTQVVTDADTLLKADKPVKELYCFVELKKVHDKEVTAVLTTYCKEIPTTVIGAIKTWSDVLAAMHAAEKSP